MDGFKIVRDTISEADIVVLEFCCNTDNPAACFYEE